MLGNAEDSERPVIVSPPVRNLIVLTSMVCLGSGLGRRAKLYTRTPEMLGAPGKRPVNCLCFIVTRK